MTRRTKAPMTRERRRATAVHEAGHVAMCLYQGVEFLRVTIRPSDDSLGAAYHRMGKRIARALEMGTYLETVTAVERLARIAFAGGAAVNVILPARRRWSACGSDFADVDRALFSLYEGDDPATVAAWRQHRRHLQLQTEQILRLRQPRSWVEWIAKALVERESLTRSEVREVIQEGVRQMMVTAAAQGVA